METLERQDTYASFLERLKCTQNRLLLLDYDGTLAPFVRDRERAFPYPEVPHLLAKIMDCGSRVVLISGRPAREVLALIGLKPAPEIWGSHGLERLTADGHHEVEKPAPEQESGLLAAAAFLKGTEFEGWVERKPGSIALHWRGRQDDEIERARSKTLALWTPLAAQHALKLLNFDGGIEIRVPQANKGNAINRILEASGQNLAVAYLGDDLTDEDAFRAVHGKGLSILVRPEPRPTEADLWLKPPEELTEFFRQWLLACGGKA